MTTNEKMKSLQKNQSQDLVKLPKVRQVVGCKWIFKKKFGSFIEEVIHYKSRLVAKGYSQNEGVDYNMIFFAVV